MGVAGAGKSTVGRALADALDWSFLEGDDYHPKENLAKMATGIPLSDADRLPWLDQIHKLLATHLSTGYSLVLACSALNESYRNRLQAGLSNIKFVYLKGSKDLILPRLANRRGHYMPSNLCKASSIHWKNQKMPSR